MTAPQMPDHLTALELERLRGELGTGLAEIKGSLALLVHRSNKTDETLADHTAEFGKVDGRLDALETAAAAVQSAPDRLSALENWRSRMGGIGAVLGTLGGAGCGALMSFLLS